MAAEDYISGCPLDPDSGGMGRGGRIYYLNEWTVVRETDKAIRLRAPDGSEDWIPKSQITVCHPPFLGMTDGDAVLIISDWLAKQKDVNWKEYIWDE